MSTCRMKMQDCEKNMVTRTNFYVCASARLTAISHHEFFSITSLHSFPQRTGQSHPALIQEAAHPPHLQEHVRQACKLVTLRKKLGQRGKCPSSVAFLATFICVPHIKRPATSTAFIRATSVMATRTPRRGFIASPFVPEH